jgi:hypothetical protein
MDSDRMPEERSRRSIHSGKEVGILRVGSARYWHVSSVPFWLRVQALAHLIFFGVVPSQ